MKIKEFFAKQSVGFYVGAAATILMLIGTIMLAANGTRAYYNDYNPIVPLLGCLAVVAATALIVVSQFVRIPHIEAVWIVAAVLATAGLMLAISMRVESMAYILGSHLEDANPLARPALFNFFASAIVMFIGIVTAVVAAFFGIRKENA